MNGPARWIPRLVGVLGVVHLVLAVVLFRSTYAAMIRAGVLASVPGAGGGYAVWFAAGGVALLTLAATGAATARATGRLPVGFGAGLVVLGLLVAVPDPVSGGWVLAVLGVLALVTSRPRRPVTRGPAARS